MGRAIYSKYTDYVGPNATITVNTGAEDTTYPAANLSNRIPSKPAQLTGTSGSWVFDWGVAQRVDWVALFHHNLDAGLSVLIQMNATNAWGGPSFSQPITIPAYRQDGFNPGPWLDLTPLAGYSAGGFRFLRLLINAVNSAAVKIGEFGIVSNKRILNPNFDWPVKKPEDRPIIENVTDYGVSTIYDLGVTRRKFSGGLDVSDAIAIDMADWWRGTRGRARPHAFVPDESVNEAWLARFGGNTLDLDQQFLDRNTIPFEIEEVSRGLVL